MAGRGRTSTAREWISAIIPVPVAFEAGLCGTAAFQKERVIVADVATEPNWPAEYRELAIRNGIRAAWSEPILTKENEVLGPFALYSNVSRVPREDDLALMRGAGHIARMAIERQRSQEALRTAIETIRGSETKLRQVIEYHPHWPGPSFRMVRTIGSTASVGMIEFEPGLQRDLPTILDKLIPPSRAYGHEQTWHDGNGHSHLRATLLGASLTVPVADGKLVLGTWQQIVHLECDVRGRQRTVLVTVVGD